MLKKIIHRVAVMALGFTVYFLLNYLIRGFVERKFYSLYDSGIGYGLLKWYNEFIFIVIYILLFSFSFFQNVARWFVFSLLLAVSALLAYLNWASLAEMSSGVIFQFTSIEFVLIISGIIYLKVVSIEAASTQKHEK